MTTDKRPKHLAVKVTLPEGVITLGGVAKGSGMIHPNMATMLAVVTTDAAIPAGTIQSALTRAVDQSFNRISVDGDTSTNDTVLLLANGASGLVIEDNDLTIEDNGRAIVLNGLTVSGKEQMALFSQGLDLLCTELAKMIVRDGEGVTKFVEIRVTGAAGDKQAHAVAETIATSPLVKTALAGSDPNWGRILAAAGRAGVPFDQMKTALWIGNGDGSALQLVNGGTPTPYLEDEAAAIFARPEIHIHLDLGQGAGEAVMWTGDLTHDYITINADYRT
jgi:glutamate N-acetyltransferase/amino-acid N-acetyltransferase